MDSHELQFFGPAILFLAVGMISILAARRLRLSPIVGFLAAGVAVAPVAHQFFGESEDVMLVAELGVIFLMFDIGLNFSVGRLWQSRKQIFGLAPLQMAAAALIFGGVAAALGFAPKAAVLIGGGMALTSTAVVIQVLREAHQEASPLGRGAVAVLLAEDIVAVVLLILAATLADDTASLAPALGLAAVKAVCVIALVAVAGRFMLKPVFAWLTKSQDEEVFTAAALLVVLVTALFTGLGGLSMPLGAFLAGMIMAETEYCYMVKAEIRPFRGLLLGFFFIAVGMSLDLSVIIANAPIVIAIAAAQMAGKGLAGAFAAKATGVPRGPTVRYAFLMANGGEFALALFSLAAAQAVIGAEAATIIIAAIVCTLVAAPALAGLGGRLAERIDPAPTAPAPAVPAKQTARPGRVVIAGAGEPGIAAARCLHETGADYLLLENDGKRFAAGRAEGLSISYGAPFDVKLLDQVGAGGAKAIVFGLTAEEADARSAPRIDAVQRLRAHYSKTPVLVANDRTGRAGEGKLLEDAGATLLQPSPAGSFEEAMLAAMAELGGVKTPLFDLRRALITDAGANAQPEGGAILPRAS